MKYFIRIVSIIGLISILQFAYSGSITDTYTTGDTLTATTLNNIKSAVNDNDTSISALFSGDGSAGDLTVASSVDWNSNPPANPYFNNIVINASQSLVVPSGTIIRCAGSFTNNGLIEVTSGANNQGTGYDVVTSGASGGANSFAHPGDTRTAAVAGQMDNDMVAVSKILLEGEGGKGITEATVRSSSFGQFRIGGGAGAGPDPYGLTSSSGGGVIKIYCQGPIVNAGAIEARGKNGPASSSSSGGGGGGGGGIVILASRTSVSNDPITGIIRVEGGNGGNSGPTNGAGGGGGGGIIVMASPTAPNAQGTLTVSGGSAQINGAPLVASEAVITAGGGGGGSGGDGGKGARGNGLSSGIPTAGSPGYVVTMTIDPITMAY